VSGDAQAHNFHNTDHHPVQSLASDPSRLSQRETGLNTSFLMTTCTPPGMQQSEKQISRTAQELVGTRGKNLLVFGLRNDSEFWARKINPGGRTVFIENDGNWFKKISRRCPELEAYMSSYHTRVGDFEQYKDERRWSELYMHGLPRSVLAEEWDVVLVDAPPGYKQDLPGRFQSIYMASILGKQGGLIVVDDCERRVEKYFQAALLGQLSSSEGEESRGKGSSQKQCYFRLHTRRAVPSHHAAGNAPAVMEPFVSCVSMRSANGSGILRYLTFSREDCRPDVFFVWIPPHRTTLSQVNCCSIMSAVRHNPTASIFLFVHAQSWTGVENCFGETRSLEIVLFEFHEIFRETALEPWFNHLPMPAQQTKKKCFTQQNLANAARLAILFKHGGMYMDMDVISINPIDVVSDRSVGLQAKKTANNAVMRFPARDPVLKSYILNFVAKFDNCKWGFNGPNRLTDTLIKLGCMQDSKVDETEHCRGVTIYGRTKFYKYHWDSDFMTRSFTDSEWDILMTEYKNASPSTHSIHVWNKFFSKRVSKNPPADTGIARFMMQECSDHRLML